MAQQQRVRGLIVRPTRVDYTGFVKLRNERTRRIEAARCQACQTILAAPRQRNLNRHRLLCRMRNEIENWDVDDEDYVDNDEGPRNLPFAGDGIEPMDVDHEDHQRQNGRALAQDEEDDPIANRKLEIDLAIGKFFFAERIPFKKVNSLTFKNLVHVLRTTDVPDYRPPDRRTLAGKMLRLVHEGILDARFSDFDGTKSSILVDSYRNKSNKKKILNFTIRNHKVDQAFLIAFDISHEKEDGPTIARYTQRAIQYAKDRLNTDFSDMLKPQW
ncbi:hypothetical protein QAD02_016253 [Eretmocerus hayati]|uniref:Uncharacterized protein n=1 Tax=Eretmocerus hayati TaxID=131215 RepID=A0ACC2PAJ8_9HYME|nr:hypothetical protein QAD02_016253 [Eretmocerus hayati]